jgi:hypothetical protein
VPTKNLVHIEARQIVPTVERILDAPKNMRLGAARSSCASFVAVVQSADFW